MLQNLMFDLLFEKFSKSLSCLNSVILDAETLTVTFTIGGCYL